MPLIRIIPILLVVSLSQQAKAQEPSALGTLGEESTPRWIPPSPEAVKKVNEVSNQPAKVRIGLRLTSFKKVTTRNRDGTTDTRYVPVEPLRHTLRARLNQTNHFFVGDWHLETVPTVWVRKTRHYEVRLNIYRRYGAFGQLEENIGSVDLSGVLDEQPDNIHVLLGVARKRLRDKFGSPLLDVVAGFTPGSAKPEQVLSLKDAAPPHNAATPAPQNEAEMVRERF